MTARLRAIGFCLAATALTACAAGNGQLAPTPEEEALAEELSAADIIPATAEERARIKNHDLLTQAAFWAEAYELNPGDREAAYELSTVLRKLGGAERASEIARQSLALYPDASELQEALGLALVASGRGQRALEPLLRASNAQPQDWRLKNALGVAYEQTGRAQTARRYFEDALSLNPGEPAVLSNLALSWVLDGDPARGEQLLRDAFDEPDASPQIRQNLALVLALQGRFEEAESVALIDATPEMAEANMSYVRAMMSNPRRWESLADAAGEAGPEGR
jgi:Flp pilus assembly protein TadD